MTSGIEIHALNPTYGTSQSVFMALPHRHMHTSWHLTTPQSTSGIKYTPSIFALSTAFVTIHWLCLLTSLRALHSENPLTAPVPHWGRPCKATSQGLHVEHPSFPTFMLLFLLRGGHGPTHSNCLCPRVPKDQGLSGCVPVIIVCTGDV